MRKNSGFTLIEVMIVAAVMAGLAAAGMSLMKSQTKQSVKISFDAETQLIANEIIGILSDPIKCQNTFNGRSALNTPPGTIRAINTPPNDRYFTIDHVPAPPINGYGNGGIQIVSYSLAPELPTDIANNWTYLTIQFQNKNILKGTAGTPTQIPRRVKLYVEVGAGNIITTCRSLSVAYEEIWERGAGATINYMLGNVGINTTTPTARLDVKGRTYVDPNNLAGTPTIALAVGDTDTGLNTAGDGQLDIYSNNVNTMNIRSGNVGIGNPTPAYRLDVTGGYARSTTGFTAKATGNYGSINLMTGSTAVPGYLEWRMPAPDGGSGTRRGYMGWDATNVTLALENGSNFYIAGGNVGIGRTPIPGVALDVVGIGNFTNYVVATEFVATSDRRAKDDIKKLDNYDAFKKICKLNPSSFTWKYNGTKDLGLIAQEVRKVFPEIVVEKTDGTLAMKYNSLISPIIASVQHLNSENEQLKAQVKAMQAENKLILEELKKIKAKLDHKPGQIIKP